MNYLDVYKGCFNDPQYSNEHHIQYDYVIRQINATFLAPLRGSGAEPGLKRPKRVIDVGSGRGQLIALIQMNFPDVEITSVDLEKFHKRDVAQFIQCDLSKPASRDQLKKSGTYDLVTCTDVFEHLDESFMEDVISTLATLAPNAIYAVANHSDVINGIELHTIQRDHLWWSALFEKYYTILDFTSDYGGRLYQFTLKRN